MEGGNKKQLAKAFRIKAKRDSHYQDILKSKADDKAMEHFKRKPYSVTGIVDSGSSERIN